MPSFQSSTYRRNLTPRDRAAAVMLAVIAVALLILALLRLGILPLPPASLPSTFRLLPEGRQQAATAATRTKRATAATRPAASPPPPPAPPPPPVPHAPPALAMSHDDFAATDIGHMAAPAKSDGDDAGTDSVAAYGPGEGPGGQRLYRAEWYREPPPGALALYLPGGPKPGWALIACRTVERYHVDNCRELDESPRGSGLARALREAAWQFLVRPPRLGGKPLVGAWVSIRFDFKENRPG